MDTFPRSRTSPFLPILCLVCGLGLGILLDRTGWLPGSGGNEPPGLETTFKPFWEAWSLVEKHYVDRKAIDPKLMTQWSIRGMLASLGDTGHTTYLSPEEVAKLAKDLHGELEGIGAVLTVRDKRPTIAQTLPDSPARKAGLKAGDVFLAVDGKPVADESPERVAALVRGKAGTKVKLLLARPGQSEPVEIEVTRGKITVPEVTWHRLPGMPIAHVGIRAFTEHTDEQLKKAIKEIREAKLTALIIDVRANPGGLKEQAVAVTSEFLKSGVVFLEQDASGKRTEVPVKPGGEVTDLPLVVLVDGGTASSAEIFAGAIQDHGRGKLVGTHTFGTGTVLRPFELSDGSAVLLAVAEWLTPKGRQFWHKGLPPDIEVRLPAGASLLLPGDEDELTETALARSRDTQLLKAIEVLTGRALPAGDNPK
jgi:carboxyl-terminal processing protease